MFPVSRIVPKNVKGRTLWDFLNIHSVAKYQKLMEGTKKFGKKSVSQCRKNEENLIVSKKGTLLLWNGILSHVRGFGCVENEVLSKYGKSW